MNGSPSLKPFEKLARCGGPQPLACRLAVQMAETRDIGNQRSLTPQNIFEPSGDTVITDSSVLGRETISVSKGVAWFGARLVHRSSSRIDDQEVPRSAPPRIRNFIAAPAPQSQRCC